MLRAYRVTVKNEDEWALLALAHNRIEARRVSYKAIISLLDESAFTSIRVRVVPEADMPYLTSLYGSDPVCVEEPLYCKRCSRWWAKPFNSAGLCDDCAAFAAEAVHDGLPL